MGEDLPDFDTYMRRHGGWLVAVIRRACRGRRDADDLVQEALCYAWRDWATFDGEAHLVHACRRFVRQAAIDRNRSREEHAERRATFPDDALGLAPDTAEVVVDQERFRAAWQALLRLPETERQLLLDHAADGATAATLAAQRGTSPGAVRIRVYRARQAIRPFAVLGLVGMALAGLRHLAGRGRRLAGALAQPSATAVRLLTGAALVVSAPLLSGPIGPVPPVYASTLQAGSPDAAARRPPAAGVAVDRVRHPAGRHDPAAPVADLDVPRADHATCVQKPVRLCVRDADEEPDPDGATGEDVCLTAVDECVGQDRVGVCPLFDPVPRKLATCRRHTDPLVDLPTAPSPAPHRPPSVR